MPKYQINASQINARRDYFIDKLSELSANTDRKRYTRYQIDPDLASAAAEAYFLLNVSYKQRKGMEKDHFTEFSKVAALSGLAVCGLQLLRPDTHQMSDINDIMANPLFAVRIGCDRLSINLSDLDFEEKDRLYQGFVGTELDCLNNYLTVLKDTNHQFGDEVDFSLSLKDLRTIEDKISVFHFLWKHLKRSN